jgi:inorganic triphosphatase YgiF
MSVKAFPDVAQDGRDTTHSVAREPVETEAKLRASVRAFRQIERCKEIAGWRVAARRAVRLRDTYWDTADDRLLRAGCTLRVREMNGAPGAELTFKGPAGPRSTVGGSQARLELTAEVPAGSGPDRWAASGAARPGLAALRQVAGDEALQPVVVLLNPRRELALRRGASEVIVSLDEVGIEGQPYRRRYVEIELKRGSREELDILAAAAQRAFGLRPTQRGKVQAAREWLAERGD